MGEQTGAAALKRALQDRRRNSAALLSAAAVLGSGLLVGTREARYLAALILFTIWMVWFVLTGIEWVKRAEF
jgi:hypothetical protein